MLKNFEAVVAKSDLPDELKKAGDDVDLWAYVSVEKMDRDGDIVRVKGIDLRNHKPEAGAPLTVVANHDTKIGLDGFPVVGKAVRFTETVYKSDGQAVPALAMGMKFADTPFAKTVKGLYDGNYLSRFSIRFKPEEHEPIRGKGFDFKKSELVEVTACVIPANADAHVMRSLGLDSTEARIDAILKPLADKAKHLQDRLNELLSLVDDTECAVVAKSKAAAEPTGDQSDSAGTKEVSATTHDDILSRLAAELNRRQ